MILLVTHSVEHESIFSRSRQKIKVEARSVFCYRVSRELGTSYTELARRLNISIPAVGYSVDRGEKIVKEQRDQLPGT